MAELSKFMKIVLILNMLAAFIYGIFYLLIPEIYGVLIEASVIDVHFWRLWGGTCVSFGIFGIIGIIRNEWDQFKIIIELVIVWLFIANILNIASFFYITRSPSNAISEIIDVVIIFLIIALDIYAYMKENK